MTRARSDESETSGRLTRSQDRRNETPDDSGVARHLGSRAPSQMPERDLDRAAAVLIAVAMRLVERGERR